MKFGQQLRSSLIKDYYYNYIAYDDLKNALKTPYVTTRTPENPHPARRSWTEEDEKQFVAELEQELDKVFTFQRVKAGEIVRRIKSSEKEVNEVVAKLDQRGPAHANGQPSWQQDQDVPTDEDFMLLEEDLSNIIADVHDLAKFTQLNYTGFQKIIKKHDKQTKWHLKPVFATRLKAKPFFKDNYDAFIVRLSKLYDIVRTRGNPARGDSAAGGGQQNFIRQTTKYWVHADNITELKLVIMKHLPVLVFNPNKEFETADSAISSIYYDNPQTWELYEGRLKKTEGAEAIRLRWYGGMDTETIFVERKTHREDWTGEKSVKARFPMKEKYVNAFLEGKMTVEQVFEKMRKDGKKSIKEIEEYERLAREIQYSVISKGFKPVCRSFYNRTAFQLPGDARVRISLDTDLTMVREDNLDGRQRSGRNWRRMDIGIDYPFPQLPPEDIERFPYAVLEVKLQTQAGQDAPEWARELISSHLVEAVPKFSKFIHGTATLFPTRINLIPFWMPQMDIDIRKPVTHRFGIERQGQTASYSTSDDTLDDSDDEDEDAQDDGSGDPTTIHVNKNGNNADQNVESHANTTAGGFQAPGNELDVEERTGSLPISHEDDYPLYDSEEENEEEELEEARRVGGWRYYSVLAKRALNSTGDYLLKLISPKPTPVTATGITRDATAVNGGVQQRKFKAPKGKRIHVPVRVEPKVYFATERTFLAWLEFSIILGSIAATLLNFGDSVSINASIGFTIVAILALAYSVGIYLLRVTWIRTRRAKKYHDKWGPTGLCIALFAAVAVNFAFRIMKGGEGGLKG